MPFDLLLQDIGPPDVGSTPQLEAPALAELSRQVLTRPPWLADQPVETDTETWKKARAEMVEIQKRRGFPLAMAKIDRVNFLLRGVPVVAKDEA